MHALLGLKGVRNKPKQARRASAWSLTTTLQIIVTASSPRHKSYNAEGVRGTANNGPPYSNPSHGGKTLFLHRNRVRWRVALIYLVHLASGIPLLSLRSNTTVEFSQQGVQSRRKTHLHVLQALCATMQNELDIRIALAASCKHRKWQQSCFASSPAPGICINTSCW
jgi:hypothetical protein